MSSIPTQFEATVQRLRSALLTLAESLISPAIRTELDASDLVQQTLLEACQQAEQLSPLEERQVFGWLRTALKHNVLDAVKHLRTLKNDAERRLRMSDLEGSFTRLEDFLLADGTSPSEMLHRSEQTTRLLCAIQELPDNQKQAVILKHLNGLSVLQVAEQLGISEAAAGGLLSRGRQALFEKLGGAGNE